MRDWEESNWRPHGEPGKIGRLSMDMRKEFLVETTFGEVSC
jgi:hypothetical protein